MRRADRAARVARGRRAPADNRAGGTRWCARASSANVPFVARGAGTGLSGGALPVADGVVIGLSRMRAILDIDLENHQVTVQPGVTNLEVSKAVRPLGYFYAPDPSSQQVCTIGGNVAENSGGAHCLKYGFTTHHVLAATFVTADGRDRAPRRIGARCRGLRPARRRDRQRGDARHRDRGRAPDRARPGVDRDRPRGVLHHG